MPLQPPQLSGQAALHMLLQAAICPVQPPQQRAWGAFEPVPSLHAPSAASTVPLNGASAATEGPHSPVRTTASGAPASSVEAQADQLAVSLMANPQALAAVLTGLAGLGAGPLRSAQASSPAPTPQEPVTPSAEGNHALGGKPPSVPVATALQTGLSDLLTRMHRLSQGSAGPPAMPPREPSIPRQMPLAAYPTFSSISSLTEGNIHEWHAPTPVPNLFEQAAQDRLLAGLGRPRQHSAPLPQGRAAVRASHVDEHSAPAQAALGGFAPAFTDRLSARAMPQTLLPGIGATPAMAVNAVGSVGDAPIDGAEEQDAAPSMHDQHASVPALHSLAPGANSRQRHDVAMPPRLAHKSAWKARVRPWLDYALMRLCSKCM